MTSDLPDNSSSTEEELPSSDDASIETSLGRSSEGLGESTITNDLTECTPTQLIKCMRNICASLSGRDDMTLFNDSRGDAGNPR